MKRFPMSVDLSGKTVFLIGSGPQIRDKADKLAPFGPELVYRNGFTPEDARLKPAMVIVGDTPLEEARKIRDLCRDHGIPVNVVDVPRLCSFHFPAIITRGDLTVSVATGGSSPELAACLRRRLEAALPEELDRILEWVAENRSILKTQQILKPAIAAALEKNRPLTTAELEALADSR